MYMISIKCVTLHENKILRNSDYSGLD